MLRACLLLFYFLAFSVFASAVSAAPAQRIISLSPDLTEILFVLGAGKNIVGVMQGSDYPEAAKKIPIVASYSNINQEAILALHPGLIVAWDVGTIRAQLAIFQRLNIPIYFTHPEHVRDVATTMKEVASLINKKEQGEELAAKFLQRYANLQKEYNHRKKVKVFYEVWDKPLMTINKNSWINEIIETCGGINIFANVKVPAPVINFEALVKANPDYIVGNIGEDIYWPHLRAVKENHVVKLDPNLLERPGPRLLDGVLQLCLTLKPALSS